MSDNRVGSTCQGDLRNAQWLPGGAMPDWPVNGWRAEAFSSIGLRRDFEGTVRWNWKGLSGNSTGSG